MNIESIQKEAVQKVLHNRSSAVQKLKDLGFNKVDEAILKIYNENPYYFEEAHKIIESEIKANRLNPSYSNNIVMIKNWMLKFKEAEA